MHTHLMNAPRAFRVLSKASAILLAASLIAVPVNAQNRAEGQTQAQVQSPQGEPGTMHLLQMSVERGSEVEEEFKERAVQVRSCEEARLLGKELSARMVENRSVRPVQLPERLQVIISKMATGQATPAFGSDDGPVRVLVLCNRF